jgi:hypothetical protein
MAIVHSVRPEFLVPTLSVTDRRPSDDQKMILDVLFELGAGGAPNPNPRVP